MVRYSVYIESGPAACLAHVVELPGCVLPLRFAPGTDVRAAVRETLPAAVRRHHAWLRLHGEPAPGADEPLDLVIAGEFDGGGPFDPGDTAALLPPDAQQAAEAQMDDAFRLMAHARADLLGLAGELAPEVLDWQPAPDTWSIRRVLRHVGDAEEWYVSRLVAPERLPAEWRDDENLTLIDFLAMERRTAVACLRALTAEERAGRFYPTAWTDHPDEPWTLGKVLRRFLEHELEHTAQVRGVLATRRDRLLAELAAARQELLAAFAPLALGDPRSVFAHWTAQDIAGHLADWEWVGVEGLRFMAAGCSPHVELVADLDGWNEAHLQARRGQPWQATWDDLHRARRALVDLLAQADLSLLGRNWDFPWGGQGTAFDWLSVYPTHDREHARDLERL